MAAAASVAVGALVAAGGLVLAAVAVVSTGRRWVGQLETPPLVTAQAQWRKLGSGVAAGTRAWKAAA